MSSIRGCISILAMALPALAVAAGPQIPGDLTVPPVPPTCYCGQRPMPGEPQGPPSFCQQQTADTQVPLQHGSCGAGCMTHSLAAAPALPRVPVQLDVDCPSGQRVQWAAYRLKGQETVVLVGTDTGKESFSTSFEVQPFSTQEVEASCRQALGGSWVPPGKHRNPAKATSVEARRRVEVWGKCALGPAAQPVRHEYLIRVRLTCEDRSF
jgi:hypothetical protein